MLKEPGILETPRRAGKAGDAGPQTGIDVEAQFRILVDLMPSLCWMASGDGWIFWYNRRWYEYTGTTPEQMKGWGWQSVHDPSILPQVVAKWRASIATGEPFEMTFPLKGKDGTFRLFLTRISPMAGADGTIVRWLGVNTDVTEAAERENALRQSEANLRASEARWRGLADAMPQLVWTCTADGSCDYLNRQWMNYTGVDARDHLGYGWVEAIHPDDRTGLMDAWQKAVTSKSGFTSEARMRGADGTYRWFKKRALPLHDEKGVVKQWFGTSTDISDIVEAREVLARNRAELELLVHERTNELKVVQARLAQSEKLTALGQLTGGVAHDFNNIIQVISGGAELLKKPTLAEDKRHIILEGILRGCANSKDLVGRLLAFGRQQTSGPR